MIITLELFILFALFFFICYMNTGNDEKNLKSFSAYPDKIQEVIKTRPEFKDKIKTSNPFVSIISNIILFGIILFIFGIFIREKSFLNNFIKLSILGQGVNLFDFLVIDSLWWRNSKRIIFSGTENMKSDYRSLKNHFISFLKAIIVFLAVAVTDGFLLTLF